MHERLERRCVLFLPFRLRSTHCAHSAPDLTTQRLDKPDKMAPDDKRNFFWERSDPRFPPCYFMLDAIRLPLLDLLVPPFTAKDDLANPEDEDFGLAAYLRNFYLNKESDDELLLAKVHEAEGCVR